MKLLILHLPNTPRHTIIRDYAGGYGIAVPKPAMRFRSSSKVHLNLFLPYSAAVAEEAGWDYEILDAQVLELVKNDIPKKIKKYDADIIFSMLSLPGIFWEKKILDSIKTELPNSTIGGCGSVCNAIPHEVFDGSAVDLIVQDYFPYVKGLKFLLDNIKNPTDLEKLCEQRLKKEKILYSRSEIKIKKEYEDYEPKYDKLLLNEYEDTTILKRKKGLLMPILGNRGCPHDCTYCPYPLGFGEKMIVMPSKNVVDNIETLHHKGVKHFLFRNQSFTIYRKWVEDICNEIIKRDIDISWYCEARVDEVTSDILEKMHLSGCKKINYGVETGDPTLISVGKPGVCLKDIKRTFDLTKKTGILTGAHIILGLPGENEASLNRSEKFLLEINPDSIHINFATPYPGTQMFASAEKNGSIITRNWEEYTSFNVVMKPRDLNPEDLYHKSTSIKNNFIKKNIKNTLKSELTISSLSDVAYDVVQIMLNEHKLRKNLKGIMKSDG